MADGKGQRWAGAYVASGHMNGLDKSKGVDFRVWYMGYGLYFYFIGGDMGCTHLVIHSLIQYSV